MEADTFRIYVDVKLFKGDFCARLSPDLLQQREIYTQTDDESSSECSAHSADTILQRSLNNFDVDGSLIGDEKTDGVNSLPLNLLSSDEDSHEISDKPLLSKHCPSSSKDRSPLLIENISNPVDNFHSFPAEENSRTVKKYPSVSRNKFISEKCFSTSIKTSDSSINKFSSQNSPISSSEEVIPPSPIHTIISSDSTISIASTKQKFKTNRKRVVENKDDDSTDNEPVNTKNTVQRRTKKKKSLLTEKVSPKKPKPKGKRKIIMNKVVYPSSYPTSAEESLSDDSNIVNKKKTKSGPLSSKILENKKAQSRGSDIISLSEDDS